MKRLFMVSTFSLLYLAPTVSPHWYTPLKNSQWWLVAAAFLTLFVIGWQAVETKRAAVETKRAAVETKRAAEATQKSTAAIERQAGIMEQQTKAMEATAEAAKASADAFITENRPWLLLCKEIGPEQLLRYLTLEPRIHNFGKTPAKVTVLQIKLEFGDKETLPHPEFFAKAERSGPFIIPQGEGFTQSFKLGQYPLFDEQRISKGEIHIWLCGLIKYEDTFESPSPVVYETRFCFRYVPGVEATWQIGPSEYNRAT